MIIITHLGSAQTSGVQQGDQDGDQGFVHASDFVLGNDFCDLTNFFFKFFFDFLFATTYIFPFGI